MRSSKVLLLSLIFLALFLVPISPCAFSDQPEPYGAKESVKGWRQIESSYTTIFVDKDIDLGDVARRIDVSFARYDPFEEKLFLGRGVSDAEQLANKIDIIVRKAKRILDMNPQGFHVNIRIYKSSEELWHTYEKIFKERKEYKSFYIHKFRNVYISLDNLSESVLAHEIGHSIIDSYFTILPPDRIRELLACYVDVHLKD